MKIWGFRNTSGNKVFLVKSFHYIWCLKDFTLYIVTKILPLQVETCTLVTLQTLTVSKCH